MSSNVSDDLTVEVTCPGCKKKFVINTTEIGEMTICPHCSTVMIAQLDDDDSLNSKEEQPFGR